MTTVRPRIAVIGSNMVDLVTYVQRMPVKGETVEAPSFEMGHGGKGANQAVAAAKLGASVVMVTAVGDDAGCACVQVEVAPSQSQVSPR